jgi:energy-coupling factor transport system ATP-binding protein
MGSERETSCISLEDVTFRYFEKGKRQILDHVSLAIPAGKIVVLAGSSGCGKSTLAAVAAGLYPENGGVLDGGEIFLSGHPLKGMNPAERSRYLAMMFQNPDLQFCMDTLRKEMRFCMENICVPREEMDGRIETLAARFGLEDMLDRRLYTLSGGEKQKAALACLFLIGAKTVLLDEPFANIDEAASREIIGWLTQLNRTEGLSVVAIDHRLDYWFPVADEIMVLGAGGTLLARGICRENFEDYRELFDREGLYYPGKYQTFPQAEGERDAAVLLENVSIGGLLEGTDARIEKGRITSVLGPSGSGKTTLFSTLSGERKYDGSIRLSGQNGMKELRKYRTGELFETLGIVFQNPGNQFITQNVLEEVKTSLKRWQPKNGEEENTAMAKELLASYGLEHLLKYSPYMLSQGQQRRLAVLAVLAGNQQLLLLDEPTYGQDYRSTMVIMEELRQKAEKEGLAVFMATHDRALAEAVSHRIYEIRDKKLVRTR